ncbi:dephospho-CoA kinase [Hylemonella gracilis]|uniref:Dephospho-CoA kinase n=1 Tax=Hylemonella gracilis ATCC 19624 TaxID=887062 RepID=F3KP55_9BURK|nr:dephospho-CoA kinase [Hylemonella gracilis]EGI78456.1 dephospho-CoA kinase [Hylemonella gracilis ATCC 19624]
MPPANLHTTQPLASPSVTLRLGLTGGIGSGKSTVASMLAGRGAVVIDADAISRASTAPGGAAIDALRAAFGSEMIAADGALDRVRMRQRVFADPSARLQLESIVHPLVHAQTEARTAEALAAGAPCIVYDVPLLVESSAANRLDGRRTWREQLDRILVVDCSPATQIARVEARSGLARSEVEAIMAQQARRDQRLKAADHVICNEGISLAELEVQITALVTLLGF